MVNLKRGYLGERWCKLPHLHHTKFPYWSSNNNFCSFLKSFWLLIFVASTKHSHSMDVVNFSKPSSFSKDLLAKFSGRCTYECNGSITRLQLRLVHDMNQCWPQEGGSLTRTCFSNAYDVSATKCHRDCLKKKKKAQRNHLWISIHSGFIENSPCQSQ